MISRVNDKGEMENVITSPVYRKDKIEEIFKQDKIGDIEERVVKFIENFWEYIEQLMLEGSGWSFTYIKDIDLKIYDYDVIAGGTYVIFIIHIDTCTLVLYFLWQTYICPSSNDIITGNSQCTSS